MRYVVVVFECELDVKRLELLVLIVHFDVAGFIDVCDGIKLVHSRFHTLHDKACSRVHDRDADEENDKCSEWLKTFLNDDLTSQLDISD